MPGLTAGAFGFGALILLAFTSGPIPGRTGGFGEMTCLECHWDNPVNDSAGTLTIAGVPASYTPGERYPITVAIAHPQLIKGGFQLSVRFEDGANAGALRGSDDRTETVTSDDGRIVYLQQTRSGAIAATRTRAEWKFDWTAPKNGAVVFHAAGNAANGDASPLGDFIYTLSASSRPIDGRR